MKAVDFVKKFGWDATKSTLKNAPDWAYETAGLYDYADKYHSDAYPVQDYALITDLKRLVKSHKIVQSFGGLQDAKTVSKMGKYYKYLKQAITDVESCQ